MKRLWILGLLMSGASLAAAAGARDGLSYYNEGLSLYNSGRLSEATDAFEMAVKRRYRPDDSKRYVDRIRKEKRIRRVRG